MEDLDELLAVSDFITLHTPLTPDTHHLLDASRLAKTKRGVRIINCARGGLIDETASGRCSGIRSRCGCGARCFRDGTVAGRFTTARSSKHCSHATSGASTAEAQESVGIEIAQASPGCAARRNHPQRRGTCRISMRKRSPLSGRICALEKRLGRFLSQVSPKHVESLNINYMENKRSRHHCITRAVLKGFLQKAGAPTSTR